MRQSLQCKLALARAAAGYSARGVLPPERAESLTCIAAVRACCGAFRAAVLCLSAGRQLRAPFVGGRAGVGHSLKSGGGSHGNLVIDLAAGLGFVRKSVQPALVYVVESSLAFPQRLRSTVRR